MFSNINVTVFIHFILGLSLKELSLLIYIMRFIFLNESGHMMNQGKLILNSN